MIDLEFISLRTFVLNEIESLIIELELDDFTFISDLLNTPEPHFGEENFWDLIGVTGYFIEQVEGGYLIEVTLVPFPNSEPLFSVPSIEGLGIRFKTFGTIRLLLNDSFKITFLAPKLALELPLSLLNSHSEISPSSPAVAAILIEELGEFSIDSTGRISFNTAVNDQLVLSGLNTPWHIAGTEFLLDPGTISLVFGNRIEDIQLLLDGASITLPPDFDDAQPVRFLANNTVIDRHGFSGEISVELQPQWAPSSATYTGIGATELASIPIGIQFVSVRFQRNILSGFNLRTEMAIPFFDQSRALIDILIDADRKLLLALSAENGSVLSLEKEGVARLDVKRLGLEIIEQDIAISFTGALVPTLPDELAIPDFSIELEELRVNSQGKVSLKEGWVVFEPELTADLVGFSLSLYKVGVGYQDKFWLSLDGKIALAGDLPSADVLGLKASFDPDDFNGNTLPVPELSLEGIYLDATIASTMTIKGGGRLIRDGQNNGFAGDLLLGVPELGFVLDVSMLAGINGATPAFPYFYLAVGVELPTGIPLGQSGMALFGAQGLLGLNVTPSFQPGNGKSWYYDWYKAPPVAGVTHSSKWTDKYLGFAFGLGVTLGTTDGFTVVSKALLALVIPGPQIILEGRAAFLSSRQALSDNPPLRALMVLDLAADSRSIQMFIEAQYEFIEGVLFAFGVLEAFSELKENPRWHIYLGRKDPLEKRVQAQILKKLMRGNAYFQIDRDGSQFGGAIGYKLARKTYGPVKVGVDISGSVDGVISFSPEQLVALLRILGRLVFKVVGIGFDFSIRLEVETKAPTPWWLRFYFEVKLNLPWPLSDREIGIEKIYQQPMAPVFPTVLNEQQAITTKSQACWKLVGDVPTIDIPVDAKLLLSMAHRVSNSSTAAIGGLVSGSHYAHIVGDYVFDYEITKLELKQEDNPIPITIYGLWQSQSSMNNETSSGTIILFSKSAFIYNAWTTEKILVDNLGVRPFINSDEPLQKCLSFGSFKGDIKMLPNRFVRDETTFIVRRPSTVIEYPSSTKSAHPLKSGLNILSSFAVNFGITEKKVHDVRKPSKGPAPVILEIRWKKSVVVTKLEATFDRALCMVNGEYISFEENEEPRIEKLILIGHSIFLKKVCYTDIEALQLKISNRINRRAGDQLERAARNQINWSEESFIFKPNTNYSLTIDIQKNRTASNSAHAVEQKKLHFKTASTPKDLAPYLRSVREPNNLEHSTAEKFQERAPLGHLFQLANESYIPIYRTSSIQLFFNESYVRKMYEVVGDETLNIILSDQEGNRINSRLTQWDKSQDRTDRIKEAELTRSVSRSLSLNINSDILPLDDVLISLPSSQQNELGETLGALKPGTIHNLKVTSLNNQNNTQRVLYETKFLSSQFNSWWEMFNTVNRLVPTLSPDEFDNLDFFALTSLDELAALPLVNSPLPSEAATVFVIKNDTNNQSLVVLELPEPFCQESIAFELVDLEGSILNSTKISRSDNTRIAWKTLLLPDDIALKVIHQRPLALQGESRLYQSELLLELSVQGEDQWD